MSNKIDEILEQIGELKVNELAELIKKYEEKFGVSAAMPTVAMAGVVPQAGQAAPQEEKTSFDVILASAGANKIAVIKEVRAITNLGLKEAKDLVDNAPKTVKENVSKEEAEEIKKKLEAAGATVELK